MSQIYYTDCPNCKDDPKDSYCIMCNNLRKIIDTKQDNCNLCGELMFDKLTGNNLGLYSAEVSGSYNSYHLLDMNKYTFSFCEACLRQLFMKCKVPPCVVDSFRPEESIPFKEDQEQWEYREWITNGFHHLAYLNKKCNKIKDCPNDAVYSIFYSNEFSEDCSCEKHKTSNIVNADYVAFISNKLKAFL